MDVALAAGLSCGDAVDGNGPGFDLQPLLRAIAMTSLSRVSERIGRASAWDALSGTMTLRWAATMHKLPVTSAQTAASGEELDDRFQETDPIGRYPMFFVSRCVAAPSW
jgi:hypothetical protein